MENTKKFKATVEWMKEKYKEMNEKLFNGELGECLFTVAPKRVRTLGWFRMTGSGLKYDYYRRLFVNEGYGKKYIDSDRFFLYARPTIGLNSYYSGTETALLSTLVHEMCHYYTYMNGRVPKQAHGVEFRDIAYTVSLRSEGKFTIQRLASAEEMENYELDADVKEKEQKKLNNRLKDCTLMLVYRETGEIELIVTKSQPLISQIFKIAEDGNTYRGRIVQIKTTNSKEAFDIYLKHGYNKIFQSYRYFPKTKDDEIIKELENTNMETHTFNQESLSIREIVQKAVREAINDEIYGNKQKRKEEMVYNITPDMDLGQSSPIELLGL